jgi:hypothetical protein
MTKIRAALFVTATIAALTGATSMANAVECNTGEAHQVVLRFPIGTANVPIPGTSLNVKSDICVPGSANTFTIDGMPGTFATNKAAADFVTTSILMKNFGTAFKSTDELAKAISYVLAVEEKYQTANKTADGSLSKKN